MTNKEASGKILPKSSILWHFCEQYPNKKVRNWDKIIKTCDMCESVLVKELKELIYIKGIKTNIWWHMMLIVFYVHLMSVTL